MQLRNGPPGAPGGARPSAVSALSLNAPKSSARWISGRTASRFTNPASAPDASTAATVLRASRRYQAYASAAGVM